MISESTDSAVLYEFRDRHVSAIDMMRNHPSAGGLTGLRRSELALAPTQP
jgi:hypothetical protein